MPATESLIGFEQAGIGSLLSQNLLRVPPNQREYAWTDLEVEQLFTDIARAIGEDADYFLGTIVTIPRPTGTLEVVDGQQRLATTAILLAAIRLYMKEIGEDVLEEAISNTFLTGIDRAKRIRVPRMTLNSSDHELFRAIVTHTGEGELPEASLESHRLLLGAYQHAQAHVERVVASFNPHDHGDRLNAWVNFLESRARVVLLKVPDDSDAYRMFETLNDRGLRTSQADLIKNYLFGRSGERIGEVQNRWAFMRGTLESIDEDDLTVTFLRHALIVQSGYRREVEVYGTVQDTVRSEDAAAKFAADLDRLATYYAASFNSDHENWNAHLPQARRAIRVINMFNIRPIRPLVLAITSEIEERKEVVASLNFLLSLGVRLLIASSTRSGSVEVPLADAAHEVWQGTIKTADELAEHLKMITPSDEQFRNAFANTRVYNPRFARYYLRSLETLGQGEREPWFVPTDDGTIINLEHILPQKPEGNWPEFTDDEARFYATRLGNLALMRASDNSSAKSAPFKEKKPFFANSPYVLTSEVSAYSEWTTAEIADRQARMAELAPRAWPVA